MSDEDTLGRFLAYADRLDSLMGARARPAYRECCTCGAEIEVGVDVPAAERKRLVNYFVSRHHSCAHERQRHPTATHTPNPEGPAQRAREAVAAEQETTDA